jgi:hypothetical protein
MSLIEKKGFKAYMNNSKEYRKDFALNEPKVKTPLPDIIGTILLLEEQSVQ